MQYLANVSQTSDTTQSEETVINRPFLWLKLSPAINGSRVPSITYFWLVGD